MGGKSSVQDRGSAPNNAPKNNGGGKMVYWFVESIVLSFFPTLLSFLILSLKKHAISIEIIADCICHGELIISAFTVTTLTLISNYKARTQTDAFIVMFFYAFFADAIQLVVYTLIIAEVCSDVAVVITASLICVIAASFSSYKGEKYINV